jgi:hypothetical protein
LLGKEQDADMATKKAKTNRTPKDVAEASEAAATERRRDLRAPLAVWVKGEHEAGFNFFKSADVSEGGIRFAYGLPYPEGTHLTLRFELPGHSSPVELNAEVVRARWHEEQPISHLRFIELSDADRDLLRAFVQVHARHND